MNTPPALGRGNRMRRQRNFRNSSWIVLLALFIFCALFETRVCAQTARLEFKDSLASDKVKSALSSSDDFQVFVSNIDSLQVLFLGDVAFARLSSSTFCNPQDLCPGFAADFRSGTVKIIQLCFGPEVTFGDEVQRLHGAPIDELFVGIKKTKIGSILITEDSLYVDIKLYARCKLSFPLFR